MDHTRVVGTKNKQPVGTITVRTADGHSYDVAIQAPGAAIRFSVGSPDAHGMVWRLWSSPHTPDLYLAVRDRFNGGDAKYSFHASGDWRLQYEYSRAQALGIHRVLEAWERPAPGENGAITVARIMLPSVDIVVTGRPEPDAAKIIWVPSGPAGALNVLVLFLVPPGADFAPPSNAPLIAAMHLADGSTVLLVRAVLPMTPIEDDMFQQIRHLAGENPPPGTPVPYTPRSDPEYRCEGYLRAVGTDDLIIADLLM